MKEFMIVFIFVAGLVVTAGAEPAGHFHRSPQHHGHHHGHHHHSHPASVDDQKTVH